jgi:hypothetical protein
MSDLLLRLGLSKASKTVVWQLAIIQTCPFDDAYLCHGFGPMTVADFLPLSTTRGSAPIYNCANRFPMAIG